jgi:hypothetical protein
MTGSLLLSLLLAIAIPCLAGCGPRAEPDGPPPAHPVSAGADTQEQSCNFDSDCIVVQRCCGAKVYNRRHRPPPEVCPDPPICVTEAKVPVGSACWSKTCVPIYPP